MQDYCDLCGEDADLAECWGSDGSMVLCDDCRDGYEKCRACGEWVFAALLTDGQCVACSD
jgi:hypothetical protein